MDKKVRKFLNKVAVKAQREGLKLQDDNGKTLPQYDDYKKLLADKKFQDYFMIVLSEEKGIDRDAIVEKEQILKINNALKNGGIDFILNYLIS